MSAAGPLGGLRVLEWTGTLAGRYAGWLLRELGATVVRTERPGTHWAPGDRVLHRGKHVLHLDPARPGAVAGWEGVANRADIVLCDEHGPAPRLGPQVIQCDLSAWGSQAPRPPLPPDDALVAAATGIFGNQWSWAKRPVWLVTPMVSYMTGILAALGVTAAEYARRRGAGAQRVSVSGLQGAFALNTGTYVTGPKHTGSLLDQGEPRGVYPTYALYRTADGWLFVGALTDAFWVKLMTVLDRVELMADERLQGSPLSFGATAVRAFVRAELEPIFARRKTAEWVIILRAADIPCGAVGSRHDLLRDPEARTLGLATPVADPVLGACWQPPGPAAFSDTPCDPPPAADDPSASDAATRALVDTWAPPSGSRSATAPRSLFDGVRVLDVTSFIAGPVCPMLLADLGADVIKIESPDGDPFRYAAFAFVGWNRNKRSLVLDLRRPEGQAVFRDLARQADVVVDNVRAGALDRLNLGWETLHGLNPRLIHLSITGFGSTGPFTHLPGFDPVFQSRGGLMQAQGGSDEPVFHTIAYNDYCAGALGALAVAAALVARERTGHGQRVDVSLFRTALVDQAEDMVLYEGAVDGRRGGRDFLGPSAAERLYACRDGWIAIAAHTDAERAGLRALTGEEVSADAPAEGPAADAIVAWCLARSRADAMGHLGALGVPAAPALRFEELWKDPLLRASGVVIDGEDPALGLVHQPGPYVTFTRTPVTMRRPAPRLGEHAEEVLGEIGYTSEEIAALAADGILGRRR